MRDGDDAREGDTGDVGPTTAWRTIAVDRAAFEPRRAAACGQGGWIDRCGAVDRGLATAQLGAAVRLVVASREAAIAPAISAANGASTPGIPGGTRPAHINSHSARATVGQRALSPIAKRADP